MNEEEMFKKYGIRPGQGPKIPVPTTKLKVLRSSEWEGYPTIPMEFYQHVLKYRLGDYMMDDAFAKRVNEEFNRLMTNESTK